MKIKNEFFINLFLLVVLKFLLEYSYIHFVSEIFAYSGFTYSFMFEKYIFGWVVFLLGYLLLYSKSKIILFNIYLILFMLYLLPNIIYYSLTDQNTAYFIAIIFPYIITLFLTTKSNLVKIPSLKKGKPFILILSLILSIVVIVHYIIISGGNMVLNFNDVYIFRGEYGALESSGIYGYLNSWVGKIFAVFLFAWSLERKKNILIILSFSLILMLFIFSGHKSMLGGLIVVPFFYIISYKIKKPATFIIIGFILLIAGALYSNNLMFSSITIRRLLFLPARINFLYFELFSSSDMVYWSNSILKLFLDYPYGSEAITHVVGAYDGHPNAGYNTGFAASGYMQAGYWGVLIYTVIVSIFVNIINTLSKKHEENITASIIVIPFLTLFTSSDMLTSFLTHGFLIAVIVLWLHEKKNYTLKFGHFKYKI
jgi:hypothetical protein